MNGEDVPIFSVREVSVKIGERTVLRKCSLDVIAGVTVILGQSGAGKSTLLKTLNLLRRPDSGTVLFRGQDLMRLSDRDLQWTRGRIGYVFQGGALFSSLSVYENLALPLRELTDLPETEIGSYVREALDRVGLSGTEALMPAELSGGMLKRAAIARALALRTEALLLDEPTTGVDPILANRVLRQVRRLTGECPVASLIVTHDVEFAIEVADRVALLFEGAIIWEGTPQELKHSNNPLVEQFLTGSLEGPIPL